MMTEEHCFGYFARFLLRGLTLRTRNMFTYVFQTLFGFRSFYASFCQFWKVGVKPLHSTLYFPLKKTFFDFQMYQFAAEQQTSTVKLLAFFQRFKTKERILRVIKSKLLVKTLLVEIILRLKVTVIQITGAKDCFRYFRRFVTRGLTHRQRSNDRIQIMMEKHCFSYLGRFLIGGLTHRLRSKDI